MKAPLVRFFPFAALALAACHPKSSADSPSEVASDSVHLFKEGKGVLFSEETKKLFALEIADATDRPVRRLIEKTAEVYRVARAERPGCAVALCAVEEAKDLVAGQSVTLRFAGTTTEFAGKLARLDAQAHAALGQVEVLIEFSDHAKALALGAFVTAHFAGSEPKTTLTVPTSALLVTADGSYVYTVNGSYLTRTRVKVGTTSDAFVAIEDGLYAGDSVATNGVDHLWLVELSALKGGTPCCPVPKKDAAK